MSSKNNTLAKKFRDKLKGQKNNKSNVSCINKDDVQKNHKQKKKKISCKYKVIKNIFSIPKRGFIIIDDYLIYHEHGNIEDFWELKSTSFPNRVLEARTRLGLSNKTKIYVDENNLLDIEKTITKDVLYINDIYNDSSDEYSDNDDWEDIGDYYYDC